MWVLQGDGPDALRLSDLSMIAPCLIMPSVCPVFVWSSEALVTWTGAGIWTMFGFKILCKLAKVKDRHNVLEYMIYLHVNLGERMRDDLMTIKNG